jgi:acyl-CoA thioesterase I
MGFSLFTGKLSFIRCVCFVLTVNLGLLGISHSSFATDYNILVIGDSLSAGYGLNKGEGFPEQLEDALIKDGYGVRVINAGVSGDTTTGGLARLDWALADLPQMVILELGANDGLRAIEPSITKENLHQMLVRLKERGVEILLAGMYAPPNLGEEYGLAFNSIYPNLAKRHNVALYPFFLEGVAGVSGLNQDDGLHPTKEGVAEIVKRILPYVLKIKEKVQ